MIELYDKATHEKVIIYKISEDGNGYPKCLIRKDGQWLWRSIKHFITNEEL